MSLPLTLPTYNLDATATVDTTINPNYTTAAIDFSNSGQSVYSLTIVGLTAPTAQLPANLKLGSYTLVSSKLTMQLPSNLQKGTIRLEGTFTDLNNPEPTAINAVVATWALNQ